MQSQYNKSKPYPAKKRFNNYEETKTRPHYNKKSFEQLPKPTLECQQTEHKMSAAALHLYSKVASNDTLTIRKLGDPCIYF